MKKMTDVRNGLAAAWCRVTGMAKRLLVKAEPVIRPVAAATAPARKKIGRAAAPVGRLMGRGYAAGGRLMVKVRKLEQHPLLFAIGLSFLLYLIVEMLSRRSVISGVEYLFTSPLVFLFNWLIVLVTLTFPLVFRHREFLTALISIMWLALGVVNCVLLGCRTTPLNATDFNTFQDVMGIVTVYFSKVQILGMAVLAVLTAALITFIFIKGQVDEKKRFRKAKALGCTAAMFALLMGATSASTSNGIVATTFHNIQDAYKDYGFAYCFACSVVDQGISKPDDYSYDSVQKILERIDADGGNVGLQVEKSDSATEETPNIIILQMESFFDVNHLKDVTYSENPVPNFDYMKENCTSGLLTVPSFGAGTANTEFEVNTGMSMEFFGPGEYPYTTIMRETTDESIANDLKDYGYSSHAIHDHTGRFYGRNWVYPNEGFDSFTSVEYMNDVERNPLNWADDSILTGEITKAMDSTTSPDYVFAVSVQGHGKYPTEPIDDSQTITVDGFNEDEAVGFEYYVNQLHEMDEFLGELTDTLSQSDEPTVLVVYGDHLPKFDIRAEDLDNCNIYQTEYVMWDNFGLEQRDRDLTTYQLNAYVQDLLGLHNGVMTQYQQYCTESDTYYSDLHTLQYDLLYGDCYAYGGTKPFEATDMQFGIDPISITGVSQIGDSVLIKGENFTKASKIFVNGDQVDTSFLSSGHIKISGDYELEPDSKIEVVQMSSKKTHLSTTQAWIWDGTSAHADENSVSQHNGNSYDGTGQQDVDDDISDMQAEGK